MASEAFPAQLPFLGFLAYSPRAQDRQLWLRMAADYILSGKAPDVVESAEFALKFSECLDTSDDEARLAVAKKLATRGAAPAHLLEAIEASGGEAARFVLERAQGFPRAKLLIAAEDGARAQSIARRDDLDDEVVGAIIDGGDVEAQLALALNPLAPLAEARMLTLAERARALIDATGDRRLADALLSRTPTRAEYATLFLDATPAQRNAILLAVQRLELGLPKGAAAPVATREAIARLEHYAMASEPDSFEVLLAEMLDCPTAMAERIASDRSGEPLVVALAALGAPNDACVRILTSSDMLDGSDYRRVGALARLQDALTPTAARRVMAAILGGSAAPIAAGKAATSQAAAAPSSDRRPRPAPFPGLREEGVTPAVVRRRRAFAFLAAHEAAERKA
jgi:hypothetical protein